MSHQARKILTININTLKHKTMKKTFFFAAAATMMMAACQKTEVVYDNPNPQEISLFAVNKVATKAPVDGATFLTDDNMDVVAYLAAGDGVTPNTFFTETRFAYHQLENTKNVWKGGRYWPISGATLNFLAVTNKGGNVDGHVENEFTTSQTAQSVKSTLKYNEQAAQTDLMFAAGQGVHEADGTYKPVDLVFHHALSWIDFTVKTTNTSGANGAVAASDPKIAINSITLNDVSVNGELNISNPNFAALSTATGEGVCNTTNLKVKTTNWTSATTVDVVVDKNGIVTAPATSLGLTGHPANFGGANGVLLVPGAQTSFTINYTITQTDGTANTFNYTHKLAGDWVMGKKYTYNVSITLTEIKVAPTVDNWDSSTESDVTLD